MTKEMSVLEAAKFILEKEGYPLTSREIAQKILSQKLVTSRAQEPIRSFENTINQHARDGELFEMRKDNEVLVCLAQWKEKYASTMPWWEELKIKVPLELHEKLQFAHQAKLGRTFEDTLKYLLESGLKAEKRNIKEQIEKKLENF